MAVARTLRCLGFFVSAWVLAGCASEPSRAVRSVSHRKAAPSYGETYVVAAGDTLYAIAFRNQLDYHELADWNGIGRDYAIYPGRVLRLTPPGSPSLPADSGPRPATAPTVTAARTIPPPVIAPPARGNEGPSTKLIGGAGGWEWPTRGTLLRAFDNGGNKGIDISGDVGQIVVASRAGKVVYSGSALKGYGELIIIKHDEETLSAYGYNRRRLVEEGETVVGGQSIAELGLGPENKPLLHFEIRDHGKPIDPKPLLPNR